MVRASSNSRTRLTGSWLPSWWSGWYIDIRNVCPTAVNGLWSTASVTQPVPSIAACVAGSASTAKIASAEAFMTVVALTRSSGMQLPPHDVAARSANPIQDPR